MVLVLLVRSCVEGVPEWDGVALLLIMLAMLCGEVFVRKRIPSSQFTVHVGICIILARFASVSGWYLSLSTLSIDLRLRRGLLLLSLLGALWDFNNVHLFAPLLLIEHISSDIEIERSWRQVLPLGTLLLKGPFNFVMAIGSYMISCSAHNFKGTPSMMSIIAAGVVEGVMMESLVPVLAALLAVGVFWGPLLPEMCSFSRESFDKKQSLILMFLLLTSLFTIVEFFTGIAANSLGLISDSFHMLLDSSSLAIGLVARFASRWKSSPSQPFGWKKYESLAGFANGVLLAFVSMMISLEGLSRLAEPPQVAGMFLLFVSICGLLVNGIGVIFFHDSGCDGEADQNMRGVYLHILTDLLGSVGVIFSSLVIMATGWNVVDPICSLVIASLTFFSSLPLIYETSKSLRKSPLH